MQELQLTAIVCAAICLLCAAAYRGRPLVPVLTGAAALLAVNMAVVRYDATTPRLLPWIGAAGLVVGIAAWWASHRPTAGPRRHDHGRRLVVAVAVLAAFLVPGGLFPRAYMVEGVQAPPVLLLVVVGLPTILTIVATMGVLATSARAPRTPTWRLPVLLGLVVAIAGTVYFQDGIVTSANPVFLPIVALPLALGAPVAALTVSAITARPPASRLVLFLPLLGIAGLVIGFVTVIVANVVARLALFPMEYGQTYDGLDFTPGAVVIGAIFGYLAGRLTRAPQPAAAEGVR
jgi:hypothetical protein